MGIAFQLNIVAGILFAYVSNYLLQGVGGENDWRYMPGNSVFIVFHLYVIYSGESPMADPVQE